MKGQKNLSRRERQIMDIVYVMGKVSVAQVLGVSRPGPGENSESSQLLSHKGFA
jgi:hypothetical protein